ncbi:hypothetical protein [Alkalicoccus saliphilus]|nr:hypothetical protein [Alkalicoccus saliphilus]
MLCVVFYIRRGESMWLTFGPEGSVRFRSGFLKTAWSFNRAID